MENFFTLPLRLDFLSAIIIILFSLFGIIFYKHKKDKVFLSAILLLQIIILGVLFNIIKHFPNILTISSSISVLVIILFLIFKSDKIFTYISFLLHFTSIIQILYILQIVS